MIDKEQAKKEFNTKTQMIIIAIVVFCVSVILFSVIAWFLKLLDTRENDKDPKNAPAAATKFTNDTNIDENGNITLGKSIAEWWEELKKSGNKITKYLNSPEELAKLMNAAMALEYPDTREHPDDPIVWEDIDINSKEIQGIVKFKRALKDGGDPISMTYVSPSEFQELINKYNSTKNENDREKAKAEALKHFTMEKTASSSNNLSTGGSPIVEEALRYACSWVGKIRYDFGAGGELRENGYSDCSHFIHRVFAHVGLMENTLEYFDDHGHSAQWGKGGDDGGVPGTVKIGTDLTKASPGDVIWQIFGTGHHVLIYLGNNKVVQCTSADDNIGVIISKFSNNDKIDQILHFTSLPTDPTGYFDPDTMTLHSSLNYNNADIAKVPSLQGMVFMGDSILSAFCDSTKTSLGKGDGVITMYQSGCRAEFFLGRQDCSDNPDHNCRDGGYFNWDKQFSKITNPTGFYLLLGQNSFKESDKTGTIKELVQKIKSKYPNKPIYISSILHHINDNGEAKAAATQMNEDLKVYCASQDNVYFSDILRGYNDRIKELTDDGDHPNKQGAELLLKNIKENIVGTSSTSGSTETNTSSMVAPIDDFSTETRQIIMNHINDFNENNFESFINSYPGGYDGYMQSLGGVFAKYGGKGKKIEIKNAGDLQEAAEFVWGMMSIWGFDYWNSKTYWSWGQNEEFEGLHNSAYYPGHFYSGGGYSQGNINDICSNPDKAMRTNCNAGIDTLLWTTNLNNTGNEIATKDKSGERIDKKEDLRIGDLVHFYHNSDETGWGHVAIVGEIDSTTGDVIMYDTGNRFITTGKYKFVLSLESGGAYDNYEKWVGRRFFNLDQTSNRTTSTSANSTAQSNSTYKVKVATWSESLDKVESDDPAVKEYDTGFVPNMTTTTIPYQEIVSKYKMPFNYLWTMLVYSQDKDYTFDLADLVKNSKIEITIHDNFTETTNIVVDKYTNYKKAYTTAKADVYYDYIDTQTIIDRTSLIPQEKTVDITRSGSKKGINVDGENIDDPKYTTTHTTINRNNTLDIALTLADSWFVKYTKKYNYNKLKESPPYENTQSLPDIENDPETVEGDFGGNKGELTQKAINSINQSGVVGNPDVNLYDQKTEYTTKVINRSTYTKNTVKSSSYVSSVPGSSGSGSSGYSSSVTNVSTGSLTTDPNSVLRPAVQGNAGNSQQGFCFAGDDLFVMALWHGSRNDTFSIYLIDANTMEKHDQLDGFDGHGNTIAYDSKTGDLLCPENNTIAIVHINQSTKTFEEESVKRISFRDTSQLAYNETHDLFIANSKVYTRDAFYSNGKSTRELEFKELGKNHNFAGSTSYGNHVYYFYAEGDGITNCYFLVCNILTGKQEEVIHDSIRWEAEEASFKRDGTLYAMYGTSGSALFRTTYNYIQDTNIDTKNVTPGSSTTVSDIARYNTGGEYEEKSSFKKVFNSHYNARSNILSVEEWLYDSLEQNSDTVNMIDITKYLIARAKGAAEDRETFLAAIEKLAVYEMTQVGTETGGLLSITSTTFTREQFIQLVQSYSAAISNGSKTKDFRDNAGIIYDVCKKNNINPVLCAAQAWQEQNWVYPSTSKYNYWGIAVYNGQNYGNSYSSMEAAVENYCKNINQRLKGENGAEKWSKICAQYNNKFTGGINNLYDVLSNWACVKNADSNHPGQAEHASLYVDSVVKCATQIFGEGALTASGGGGNFLTVAQNIWKKICSGNYSYGGSSIPCTGSTVDCSSYASWVLYEYGYTDFKGGQHCTKDFKNTNWNQKYGWTEINVEGGQNPFSLLQPGDLFVRDPGNNNGHITLVVRKENGKIYCYDCGNSNNWRNNPNADALDKSYMLTDSRSGKIIRVTPKQ